MKCKPDIVGAMDEDPTIDFSGDINIAMGSVSFYKESVRYLSIRINFRQVFLQPLIHKIKLLSSLCVATSFYKKRFPNT